MAKRKFNFWRKIRLAFWLLWSSTAVILFSFGMLAFFNEQGKFLPIIVGGGMIIVALFLGRFTTETAVAMRKQ